MFTHPLHKDSSLESLYGQYEQKAKVSVGFNKKNNYYCTFSVSIDFILASKQISLHLFGYVQRHTKGVAYY